MIPTPAYKKSNAISSGFEIGGVRVHLFGERPADVALVRPLEPFRVEGDVFDVGIHVGWVRSIPRSTRPKTFDSGTTWSLHETEEGFGFDFHSPSAAHPYKRLVTDMEFRTARLLMNEEYFNSVSYTPDPLGYPLDELLIMHRLTQEKAIELHGAGIVTSDGVGNLFIGHSEAGKSTTTRLWTACEDVEVLSDDRIIVRRDVDSGVGILRLRDRSASPSSHSAQDDKAEKQIPRRSFRPVRNDKGEMRMYGTPWHGEAMYASPNSAPLTRILILEHGHGNILTPLSPSEAVAELFARSFVPFHRHEYVESALTFLQEVVEAVPVYRYSFEPDHRAVDTILNLRD